MSARVDVVLAQAAASGIPEPDLEVVAGMAALAISSAEEWNAFDWSSAGGSSGDEGGVLSLFYRQRFDSRPLKVIGADAAGCFSTVKGWKAAKVLLYGAAPEALLGECGFRAAFASGAAILAML